MQYSMIWINQQQQSIQHRRADTQDALEKIIRKEHLSDRADVRIITPDARLMNPITFVQSKVVPAVTTTKKSKRRRRS